MILRAIEISVDGGAFGIFNKKSKFIPSGAADSPAALSHCQTSVTSVPGSSVTFFAASQTVRPFPALLIVAVCAQ